LVTGYRHRLLAVRFDPRVVNSIPVKSIAIPTTLDENSIAITITIAILIATTQS